MTDAERRKAGRGVPAAAARGAYLGWKDAALEFAQRQSAAKSQFLGTVSHELRTPIHGMLGVARLVHVESSDPLVKKRMELVEASGTHLLGLVTDLIDVSRVESGQMRIQRIPFDLRTEIEQRCRHLRTSCRGEGARLHPATAQDRDSATWVTGDPARVRQVLHNLLGNAIKFTQKGWIHLMVRLGSQPGDFISRSGIRASASARTIRRWSSRRFSSSARASRGGVGNRARPDDRERDRPLARRRHHCYEPARLRFGVRLLGPVRADSRTTLRERPRRSTGWRQPGGVRQDPAGRGQRRQRAGCRRHAGQPGSSGRTRLGRRRGGAPSTP